MKNTLSCLLGTVLAASAANAAGVRMNFTGDGQFASVAVGQTFEIEYWLDIPTVDTSVAGYQFPLQAIAGDPVVALSYSPDLSLGYGASDGSFANHGFPAPLGIYTGFAIFFRQVIGGPLVGVTGPFLLGTAAYTATAPGDYELAFDHDAQLFIDRDGYEFAYDAGMASYPGYFAYGDWGNPGVPKAAARNPLLLHVTPEPTSLALLAFGGFAVLCRRR